MINNYTEDKFVKICLWLSPLFLLMYLFYLIIRLWDWLGLADWYFFFFNKFDPFTDKHIGDYLDYYGKRNIKYHRFKELAYKLNKKKLTNKIKKHEENKKK